MYAYPNGLFDEADALFGLGYVHAQDRLWQMEFQRRVAQGRLSEVVGPEGLPADRLLRTIGLMRAAREAWPKIDGRSRALIEAYVTGINAFLADHRGGGLPVEFALMRTAPEPWTGEDVVAWQKTMVPGPLPAGALEPPGTVRRSVRRGS